MKSFAFVLSLLGLLAIHPADAFAPNSQISLSPKQSLKTAKDESSTALEAYALGPGYTNGNNLMYDSRFGRYGYGGYGGYRGMRGGYYDRPFNGGGYTLPPNGFGGPGYGGGYYEGGAMSPYRYNGQYNDRFDYNRRYFNTWSDPRRFYDSPYRYNGYYNRLERFDVSPCSSYCWARL